MIVGPPRPSAPLNGRILGADPWNRALDLLGQALMMVLGGEPAEGERRLEEVLTRFRALGERWGTAQALDGLAQIASRRGEWLRAHALWRESLELFDELGALDEAVDVLVRRAESLTREGDLAAAADDLGRAAELSRRTGRPDPPAAVHLGLGEIARFEGDLTEARRRFDEALRGSEAGTFGGGRQGVLTALGRLAETDGDAEAARAWHHRALTAARQSPLRTNLADATEGHAGAALLDDAGERAAVLLGVGVALRGTAVARDRDVERVAARARELIGADGRPLAVMPGDFTGGDIEIHRGDLAAILYERTAGGCEYVFDDSITSLTETAAGVHVTFERGAPRTFDIIVGADGIHSNVRRLAFGPESDHVRFLGHYYALADLGSEADPGTGGLMYNEPGRMVSLWGAKARAFFVFASERLDYDRWDTGRQKRLLAEAYEGAGWKVPQIIAMVPEASDFHLDEISRVEIDRYAKGRVVLLGDAAYGNTLQGFGTGLALVGAYVLAGELVAAGGDHRTAFRRYEERLVGYAKITRKGGNAGSFLAPSTPGRIRMRNRMFKHRTLLRTMLWLTDRFATNIDLPDHPALAGAR